MAEQAILTHENVGERAGWVYLDPDDARRHPDYGVFGWALFLLGALFVGPVILLWQDVEIVFGPYDRAGPVWMLLLADVVLLGAAWTACRLLGGERPQFYSWFFLTVVLTACSLAAFVSLCLFDVRAILAFGVPEPQPIFLKGVVGDIPGIVGWGIGLRLAAILFATLYVVQSRRLSVTLAKKVMANDPFLARTWRRAATPDRTASDRPGPDRPDRASPSSHSAPVAQAAPRTAAEPPEIVVHPRPPGAAPAPDARAVSGSVSGSVSGATTGPTDDRRLRARLKQLDDARAAGLISETEYNARRQALQKP